jgi:hypothetical protein
MSKKSDKEEDDSWQKAKFDEEKQATDNYFGSKSEPETHGHVIVDTKGEVVYERDAGERSNK